MRTRQTDDFASSAMVRVLARGMALLGLRVPAGAEVSGSATVPLDAKRAVVTSALEQGGLACLPLLGRGLHDLAMEPTHLALTAGREAGAMFARWQRLERYIHSQHRLHLHERVEHFARVEHVHKDAGSKPLPVEDLVVCGVLCALLEANGLESVRAQSSGVEIFPCPDPDSLSRWVQGEATGQWTLSWNTPAQQPRLHNDAPFGVHLSPKAWTPFARSLGDLVVQQLPERLRIDDAAARMGLSRRSLQRALANEGLTYQQLQGEVRFRLAGWHLLQDAEPVAVVGFVCGYSDQAHLTREFNKRVGVPPARYRELFTTHERSL